MNLAYFRKSTLSVDETTDNIKHLAKEGDWNILGEFDIPEKQGKMILVCRPEWVSTLAKENHQLLGFLPCAITVLKKGNQVLVGTGQPAVIKAISQSAKITEMAAKAEEELKSLINSAANVEELKPTHVKLYSTTTCPYCKMEKSWLDNKGVKHEVVYVDLNQQEAEAMVNKTGQMGVPVTEIMYEGEESEYIVGFDKPKLASLLGVSQ